MQEVAVPDAKIIEKKSFDALTHAGELEIVDDASYKAAGAFAQALKDLEKEVDRTFDDSIEAAHRAHKSMINAKKMHADPIQQAAKITKWKMARYYDEQEAKRRAEQARIDEENRKAQEAHRRAVAEHEAKVKAEAEARAKLEADAARARLAAVQAGKPAPAAPTVPEVAPAPAPVAPVLAKAAPAAPTAAGVSMVETWKFEVVDLRALIAAVAGGTAPIEFLQANSVELGKEATRSKGKVEIDGIHFYAERAPRVR